MTSVAAPRPRAAAWRAGPLVRVGRGVAALLAMGALEPSWRSIGAALNVVAIVWFALTVVAAALHWRFTTKEGLRRCA